MLPEQSLGSHRILSPSSIGSRPRSAKPAAGCCPHQGYVCECCYLTSSLTIFVTKQGVWVMLEAPRCPTLLFKGTVKKAPVKWLLPHISSLWGLFHFKGRSEVNRKESRSASCLLLANGKEIDADRSIRLEVKGTLNLLLHLLLMQLISLTS